MKSIKTDLSTINEFIMYRRLYSVFDLSERLRLLELYYSIPDLQLDQMINLLTNRELMPYSKTDNSITRNVNETNSL
jgi:hypothetical protein